MRPLFPVAVVILIYFLAIKAMRSKAHFSPFLQFFVLRAYRLRTKLVQVTHMLLCKLAKTSEEQKLFLGI